MKNLEVARIFRDIAGILEIKGENAFRIRAYERAATNFNQKRTHHLLRKADILTI